MSSTSSQITELSAAQKRALLARLLKQKVSKPKVFPLSYQQERQWIFDQLEPNGTGFNIPYSVRLGGPFKRAALERTFNEIIRRHESLRTTFAEVDGQPSQVVAPTQTLTLPLIDLSGLEKEAREAEAQKLAASEGLRPFDFRVGPLLRVCVVRMSEEDHVLLFTMHHIISDGWSITIFNQEFATIYAAFEKGEPSPLPELSIQYSDFAIWQREWMKSDALETQLAYWKKQLANTPVLDIPGDRPRPAVHTFDTSVHEFMLPKHVYEGLVSLSQQRGMTLFMTLLACFQALLHRYSGQDDISVGTFIANRNRAEIEALIGFFVNNLVLRTDLSGDPTFNELLARVHEVTVGAYEHQDVPFEKLLEVLQPVRDPSRTPLYQVMMVLQNISGYEDLELRNQAIDHISVRALRSNFDLSLRMMEQGGNLGGVLEYNIVLFDAATIERMVGHLQRLCEGVVANPEQRLSELPLLTDAEREQLINEWNATGVESATGECLHELFEKQVERTPEAVAVVAGNAQLSYRELNRRANQLAHYLQTAGVSAEIRVGICVERSLEMIIALLGVLKAGAAYVPLDPAYPVERLALMSKDAGVGVLLTQQALSELFSESEAKVICLDTDWEEISQSATENLSGNATDQNAAYVIYTSGSTGMPKGVVIQHRSVVSYTETARDEYKLCADDRVLQFASISFDAAAEEIFPSLASGATLCLRTATMLDSVAGFLDACREQKLTVLDLPTAYWHHLTSELSTGKVSLPETLRLVIIGGERALPEQWLVWQQQAGARVRLVNTYGPTEATIVATACDLTAIATNAASQQLLPIGRAVRNVQAYVLDGNLRPCPLGIPGELHIGGAGLSRGYLHRPDLTAEKFVPNPFAQQAGERLYRTGDVARYLASGTLEYMGRIDQQVKVRGFRIELGEIESMLATHTKVGEAVVVVHEEVAGEKRLIAYVVPAGDSQPSTLELRKHLEQRLPGYMLPAAFVLLEELPLTPSGKLDRRALPAPTGLRPDLEAAFTDARTPVEASVAQMWREVLRVERVGVEDNFFQLGGHSLLATQVVSRVREALGVEVPLRVMFEHPTVTGLAVFVETAMRAGQGVVVPPIERVTRDEPLPLSFAQQRLWFLDQLLPGSAFYNIPAAVRLRGQLDTGALELTFNEVVRRHESLRTTFVSVDGQPVQIISADALVTLPVFDISELAEDEREAAAQKFVTSEAQQAFELATGPLFRVKLVRLAAADHVLTMTMHHIVSDGWSMGVLIRELSVLYVAYAAGEASPLPELAIQYADYAHWQRAWLSGEVLDNQLEYWKRQLAGAPPLLALPTDRPRPSMQTYNGALEGVRFTKELTEKLEQLSQREGATLYMTLLAGFQCLLARYTGQDDIVVGAPIANRDRGEIEPLIGFFANTLVLRTQFEDKMNFRELLKRVKDVALGAYMHPDVPFEKLVEELQPERSLSHAPLFQVLFALQNAPRGTVELPGLQLSAMGGGSGTAKFDLLLNMTNTAQGLTGSLEFNTDLFDRATVRRMRLHFEQLLESVVARPTQQLSAVPLLTEDEEGLLAEWNSNAADYPSDECLHHLFEQQAALTPESIAVVFGDERLTYHDLDNRANQLAHHLQQCGVVPETLVGVFMHRSVEMVVALLAILKAGGAYLPLDPDYPQERLSFMLEDTQSAVLLTQQSLLDRLPSSLPARVICLDTDWEEISAESERSPRISVNSSNLAYVIYTSGSTGRPKGVMIPHRALVNNILWMQTQFPLSENDAVLQKTPFSFDASVWEFYAPLLAGARLVMARPGGHQDSRYMAEIIDREQVTTLQLVPSSLRMVLEDESLERCTTLRRVYCGGEALTGELVERFYARVGWAQLYNLYGPTEVTIDATFWECERGSVRATVPIGRPIANTEAYVLGGRMEVVGIGMAGELYLGGAGIGRGYMKGAEQTAERFVPHPYSVEAGARLYRTGDAAKYAADGNIEYLGRLDEQVKVRGFRIEPGEIEAALVQHEAVSEAVVVVTRGEEVGAQQLVAYVVAAEEGREVTPDELRVHLRQRLPEYMIPSFFMAVEEIPLTPSGKVDRRALPEPGRNVAGREYVAPRNEVETMLAQMWSEVLGVEQVGVDDNFFELGGHSLLATQIISRVRAQFEVELPLRRLFETPTVATLADEIAKARSAPIEAQAPAIVPVSRAARRMNRNSLEK